MIAQCRVHLTNEAHVVRLEGGFVLKGDGPRVRGIAGDLVGEAGVTMLPACREDPAAGLAHGSVSVGIHKGPLRQVRVVHMAPTPSLPALPAGGRPVRLGSIDEERKRGYPAAADGEEGRECAGDWLDSPREVCLHRQTRCVWYLHTYACQAYTLRNSSAALGRPTRTADMNKPRLPEELVCSYRSHCTDDANAIRVVRLGGVRVLASLSEVNQHQVVVTCGVQSARLAVQVLLSVDNAVCSNVAVMEPSSLVELLSWCDPERACLVVPRVKNKKIEGPCTPA